MARTTEIKKRIEAIEMIGSITNAMYLVSAAKLQKHQKRIDVLKEYEKVTRQHMAEIFAAFKYTDEAQLNPYMRASDNPKRVAYIVFTSSMGLCGSYNENVIKELAQQIDVHPEQEPIIYMIGRYGYNKAMHRDIPVYRFIDPQADVLRYSELRRSVTNEVLDKYYKKEYDAIKVVYTSYVNPLTQHVVVDQVLPLGRLDELLEDAEIIFAPYTLFEPSREEVLEYMVQKNVKSRTYIHYLESQTSEEAMRRLSMDNANKNGTDLKDRLQLQYNRERQAKITQEMTEIISGSSLE